MVVGIEDCLHIEFDFSKSIFHLKDCIQGQVSFELVRIKLKQMELSLIKKETLGSGPNQVIEQETLSKFEIMDGAPVKGEVVPVRFFLGSIDHLTPSYRNINKRVSCQYFLNIVLLDE